MWYVILYFLFAIWVFWDGQKRKTDYIQWTIATWLLGPLVLPVYFAKRPLKAGEVREGGTAWNILKNFAIFWTITMAILAIWGMVDVSEKFSTIHNEYEQAGAAIGGVLGFGIIIALWFFPMVGAVVLGFILKKSSVIEKGPTGPLAISNS